MNPDQFIEFLSQFLEGRTKLTLAKTKEVEEKLNSVFNKVTPTIPKYKIPATLEVEGNFLLSEHLQKDRQVVDTRLYC